MANGFGSLYVGASGLQNSQNGLNVIANNMANVNTTGYVRQQVVYADKDYTSTGQYASISKQKTGLGVTIGDVTHTRDVFLDASYRTQSSRKNFYSSLYDATSEVETFLQEMDGADFKTALSDLYSAFAEYAKDPSDSANQNLVVQKSELFISRAKSVYDGLKQYQTTINTKINNDVDRINEIGKAITKLNVQIQRIEAAGVETAASLRDERDNYLDELSGLANISYSETFDGIVKVKIEGQYFVTEVGYNEIKNYKDAVTGFVTPYWDILSDPDNGDYYNVFDLSNVQSMNNNDKGEVKALLLARGDHYATYLDLMKDNSNSEFDDTMKYDRGIGNSVIMNAQAELDNLVHSIVTSINNLFSPTVTYAELQTNLGNTAAISYPITGTDADGNSVTITADTKVLDSVNCSVGSDKKLPPAELFSRNGADRYTEVTVNGETVYVYNEEAVEDGDPDTVTDTSKDYTINSLSVNSTLVENQSLIPFRKQATDEDSINYDLASKLEQIWASNSFYLNPDDGTPTTFQSVYTKLVGNLGTNGNIYKATTESLTNTVDSVDANRQQVFGVSSDEELTTMIKYQNAYNASSRYINVVNSMIEYLLTSTGA
ncbi:MAG: flagellar hook-associated protein FlgK [Lachnospiraceae bacterium]|nr:flagellar hook-associated protein FlgK [Lachnospiraceae bacterium]